MKVILWGSGLLHCGFLFAEMILSNLLLGRVSATSTAAAVSFSGDHWNWCHHRHKRIYNAIVGEPFWLQQSVLEWRASLMCVTQRVRG